MMLSRVYDRIIWFGLAAVMVFAPLARGAVSLWSITLIETVVAALLFLWLWRVNNSEEQSLRRTKIDLPLWLFVALAGVSCVFSIYKHASFLGMMRLMTIVAVYYLAVNDCDHRRGDKGRGVVGKACWHGPFLPNQPCVGWAG